MGSITMIKIRARITIGSLVVETPFIRSFNVSKSRGQVSTFSAVLKVPHDDITDNITGDNVIIEAGENNPSNRIFTGMIRQAKISPCWDDPYYVDLSVSGADRLSHLQNKKYTRRCRSSRASWVSINSVVRSGLKSGKFTYVKDPVLETSVDGPLNKEDHITYARNVAIESVQKTAQSREISIRAKNQTMEEGGEEQ